MTMALRVMATIRRVVRMERKTCLIYECPRTSGPQPKDNAIAVNSICNLSGAGLEGKTLSQAGPIVRDQDGIAGIRRVVLHAGLLAGHQAIEVHLAFEAGNI